MTTSSSKVRKGLTALTIVSLIEAGRLALATTARSAARVCRPGGMRATEFLQSDQLPGRAAVGYLAGDGSRLWLHETRGIVILEGYDAGVSFRTRHDPVRQITYTVMSNTSEGA